MIDDTPGANYGNAITEKKRYEVHVFHHLAHSSGGFNSYIEHSYNEYLQDYGDNYNNNKEN